MKATITIHRREEIDIPDLPEDVVQVVKDHGAQIGLWVHPDEDDDGTTFAEVYAQIEPHAEALEEAVGALETALEACEGYDASRISLMCDQPWYQSDGPDGEDVLNKYMLYMVEKHLGVVVAL